MQTTAIALKGRLQAEPKIVSYDPVMIVFKLELPDSTVNCFMVKHALTFLYQAGEKADVALYGHYNKRHQFIVNRAFAQPAAA